MSRAFGIALKVKWMVRCYTFALSKMFMFPQIVPNFFLPTYSALENFKENKLLRLLVRVITLPIHESGNEVRDILYKLPASFIVVPDLTAIAA